MELARFAVQKLLQFFLLLLGILTLVFWMVDATGIDPCLIPKATHDVIAACHARWGLDQPFVVRLLQYFGNLVQLDLGESYQHQGIQVTHLIWEGLPNTLKLVSLSLPLALCVGLAVGVVSAVARTERLSRALMAFVLIGIAVPEFVIGPVLVLVFSMWLQWIPVTSEALQAPSSYVLPVLTLSITMMTAIARLSSAGLREQFEQDYIRTARAKGLRETRVVLLHALRLGVTPVLSYAGPLIAGLMTGASFVVEILFGIPGLGLHFVKASASSPIDFPMIMGSTMLLSTLILALNFGVDMLYAVLDPRLRQKEERVGEGGVFATLKAVSILAATLVVAFMVARFLFVLVRPLIESRVFDHSVFAHVPLALGLLWLLLGVWLLDHWRILRKTSWTHIRTQRAQIGKTLAHDAGAIGSVGVIYIIVLLAVLGPWVAQYAFGITYDAQDLRGAGKGPSLAHWFGTDKLGRDLLVRTLVGIRMSLMIGLSGLSVSMVIGVAYGTVAGYFGGRVDAVMMRFVDILYSLPELIVLILFISFVGQSIVLLFIAIGCVSWRTLSRVTRGEVLRVREMQFVQAARALGGSPGHIMRRHVLPNVLGVVVTYASYLAAGIILFEAFFSFLGLGVQEPMTSLGILVRDGGTLKDYYPWLLIFPGFALAAILYSLNFAGDGLRDAVDPRRRGVKT